MPITFHCPNPTCRRTLTVKDEAAGRTGKCPSCGTAAVVPQPQAAPAPAPAPELDPYALAANDDPPSAAPPRMGAVAAGSANGVSDGEPGIGSKTTGPAVDLSAIGLGMSLLGKRLWTWVLALLVIGFAVGGLNIVLALVSIPIQWVLTPVLGQGLASAPVGLIQFVGIIALQGILMGGAYRMALRQLDGHEISVGDIFAVSDVAVKLALVWLLVGLITGLGYIFLVIPGLILAGLLMFALPLVVDGKLGPIEALRTSFDALKSEWLKAGLFVLILGFISLSGVVACFVGTLFTAPIALLSTAAQYRRVFAPGAKQRRAVVLDPWADAVGQPLSERRKPKMPGLAWALFVVGLLVPVIMIAVVALFVGTIIHAVQRQPQSPPGFPAVEGQPGQLPPGFPKMDIQPGQLPPGFPKMDIQPGQLPPGFPKMDIQPGQLPPGFPKIEIQPGQAPPGFPGAPPANNPPPGQTRVDADPAPVPAAKAKPKGAALSEAPLAEVSANLDSPDSRTRHGALAALTRMTVDPTAQDGIADKLRKSLDDPDIIARLTAMQALGIWGRPEDTPAMVAALDDPQRNVARGALAALGRHKDPDALGPMLARASDKTLHGPLLSALRAWGPTVEPELVKHLSDDDRDIRQVVCEALRDVGTPASLIPLRNASRDSDAAVADKARSALDAIAKRNGAPTKKRTMVPRARPKR